jgi:type I restriction enzyme M protein
MNAAIDAKKPSMNTKEIIDRIFKDPATIYELTEFQNLGKAIHDILAIYSKTAATGRDEGKVAAAMANVLAESEFEKYPTTLDRLFESNFDRLLKQLPSSDSPEEQP